MMIGYCYNCQEFTILTKHHLGGINKNPLSPIILLCLPCHNQIHFKKSLKKKSSPIVAKEKIKNRYTRKYGKYWC